MKKIFAPFAIVSSKKTKSWFSSNVNTPTMKSVSPNGLKQLPNVQSAKLHKQIDLFFVSNRNLAEKDVGEL